MARDDPAHDDPSEKPRYRQTAYAPRNRQAESRRCRTRGDWERIPADPDLERDLGYRIEEWEAFRANDEGDSVMFLPGDEDLLRTDAFVVADANSVCDVCDRL